MIRRKTLQWLSIAAAAIALVASIALAERPKNLIPSFANSGAWSIDNPGNLLVRMVQLRTWNSNTFGARVYRVDGNPADAAIVDREPLSLVDGHRYTLSVLARADAARSIQVVAHTTGRNAKNVGLDQPMAVGFPYQTFHLHFIAVGVGAGKAVIGFRIGQMAGSVWLEDIHLIDDGPAPAAPTAST